MKAITIHPVWAWAIVHGHKTVENRTWRTKYRGPLLVHASAVSVRSRAADAEARRLLKAMGIGVPEDVPTSAIVGQVELVEVSALRKGTALFEVTDFLTTKERVGPLCRGPYCWILREPQVFDAPIRTPGRQGLWTFDKPPFCE